MKTILAAILVLAAIGCARPPEGKEAVNQPRKPIETSEIAKDPSKHWNDAFQNLDLTPEASSQELASAATLLAAEARKREGEERKTALDANRDRIQAAIDKLNKLESSMAKTAIPELRMQLAKDSLAAGDMKAAEEAAESVLAANTDANDWNYGNAIYEMNMVMAGVALERGIPAEARRRVLLAADTPGSPQLGSFGPKFPIAYRLYKEGDKDLMPEFLAKVGKFWKSKTLEDWLSDLKQGREPNDERWRLATQPG